MSALDLAILGLRVDSPLAIPSAANYRPPSWPPPSDWPVMIDANGEIISRWGDSLWRLDPWKGSTLTLNFGDGLIKNTTSIDPANANLLRLLVGWRIWGPQGIRTPKTLASNIFGPLRAIIALCSREGILASDLMRFPAVADKVPEVLAASQTSYALTILHDFFEQREALGFTLFNKDGLTRLESCLQRHESRQTPYIPPRIWSYQLTRLRECLDDFLAHREQVEECFQFCLNAYAKNYGSLTKALSSKFISSRGPFRKPQHKTSGQTTGCQFHGHFAQTASHFGISDLLGRWVDTPEEGDRVKGISLLTWYMTLVSRVGLAYLLNFSLMRIEEAWNLRANCLSIEHDENFGDIYILCGQTTKTQDDPEARWPTSPSVKVAIDAMKSIAQLRMQCTKEHPNVSIEPQDITNIYLTNWIHEPWTRGGNRRRLGPLGARPNYDSYRNELVDAFPRLFDKESLRITEHDMQLARLVTPTLDNEVFKVGQLWSLSWHQLRRTGAVNMQSSGLISEASLQYLLKHVSRAMSLYYGQGYSRLRLDEEARALYIRTMYEVLSKELAQLPTSRYISPHGEKRKEGIVKSITLEDAAKLTKMARNGQVSCRQILLGYCMNREPCPYGGVDSVAHCGGGDSGTACADVLYDIEKQTEIRELSYVLNTRLIDAPHNSPLRASLEAQIRSVENYFEIIG